MPPESAADGPLALLRIACSLAWRNKIRLITCTTAGMLLAFFYAQSLPRTYTATATLLLEPRQLAYIGYDATMQQSLDLNSAESELQIVRSERLLSAVFDSLNLQDDPELGPQGLSLLERIIAPLQDFVRSLMDDDLTTLDKTSRDTADKSLNSAGENARRVAFSNFVKRLSARRVGQSYVVEIDYSSSNPERPAKIANATVSGYILQSVAFKEQMARAGSETLQGRLDALAAQVAAAQEAMKNGTLPAVATPDADGRIIGAALPPLSPSSPRTSLITALGGLLGLIFGMSTIALSVAFDRKVRSAKTLTQETGISCLATVPESRDRTSPVLHMDSKSHRQYAAAIRDLRTSIDISCASQRRERNIVIGLVGARTSSGTSTLCLSLAQLVSRSGRHVTLFRSAVEMPGDSPNPPSASLADVAVANLQLDQISFGNIGGIEVLPIQSKDLQTNIFADFRHPRISRIIEAARLKGDVILDLPALDTSMDALALAFHADAILVIARAARTAIEDVKDAHQQLRRAGATVIGTVINRARS
ncbi:Wzz/FepE/Etk N-terminal domain-containing protein [Rhizobium sp. LC145]|uniref:Wzz/FepE/Etk N-terminal domain-containing protein n=1 Tax=Rhizobium sp. LC145 TaxID=1120688 RepID=UPI001FDA2637|nr:Wzz/FepE/Etk N-terminal domain-containing protein [Rhizobium sp. LC145]